MDIDPVNGTGGTLEHALVFGEQYRRAIEHFGKARCGNAYDAGIPRIVPKNDCARFGKVPARELHNGGIEYARFLLLAHLIKSVELADYSVHLVGIAFKEQLHGKRSIAHPPGGIEPRRNGETEIEGIIGLFDIGNAVREPGQPRGTAPCTQRIKPELDERTVFPGQRNDIGNGRKPCKRDLLHCRIKPC